VGLGIVGAGYLYVQQEGLFTSLRDFWEDAVFYIKNGVDNLVGRQGVDCESGPNSTRPKGSTGGAGGLDGGDTVLKDADGQDDDNDDDDEEGTKPKGQSKTGEISNSQLMSDIWKHLKPDWLLILSVGVVYQIVLLFKLTPFFSLFWRGHRLL
jgi:hypothetical protein